MCDSIATASLGQSIRVLSGFAFPSARFNQLEGLPLIRIRDLASADTEVRFRGQYDPAYLIKKGDVLIGMDGDFEVHRWNGDDALLNQRVCKIEAATPQVDQGFLYWYLKPKVAEIHRRTPQTTVRHLSASDLHVVPVPPISAAEQSVVAQILDTLDTAIHETEAIIAKLRAVKQGLLHDLLSRGIAANGELRPPQAEAPHLYKPAPLGWIPKEWDCVRLAEKLGVFGGKRLPAGHSYADHPTPFKYLRVTDFFEREYSLGDLENLHERTFKALERYEIRPEQLYISIAGSLGYVGVHRADGDESVRTILTENAARLVPLCTLVPDFIAAYMNSNMVQSQVTSEKGTGGGVPKLALFRIEQFWLAWPSEDEQGLIAERLRKIDERISNETKFLRKLMLQKAGLMDDLLTGHVRVTPLLNEATP